MDWDRHLARDYGKGPATPDHLFIQEAFQLTDLAEELGFDSVWSPEHHFDPYAMAPDGLQILSYYAGRNKKLSVASMVVVLPWHDPIRVAEQIALLDIMLDGREFIIGFGRGLARHEFELLRIPMDTSRERFREAFDIIKLALTQESFTYDGKFSQIPETVIRPAPKSKDLMDRVYISSITPPSIATAAEVGAGLMIIPQKPWDDHVADLKFYNRSRGEAGMAPRSPVVGTFMYCAETEEEGLKRASRGGCRVSASQRQSITSSRNPITSRPPVATSNTPIPTLGRPSGGPVVGPSHEQVSADRAAWHTSTEAEQVRGQAALVVGTPEQCVAKLKRTMETTAPVHMFAFARYGGMPYEKAKRSLELFAKEVLPEVHRTPITDPIV